MCGIWIDTEHMDSNACEKENTKAHGQAVQCPPTDTPVLWGLPWEHWVKTLKMGWEHAAQDAEDEAMEHGLSAVGAVS